MALASYQQYLNKCAALATATTATALLVPLGVELKHEATVKHFRIRTANGPRTVSRQLVQLGPIPVNLVMEVRSVPDITVQSRATVVFTLFKQYATAEQWKSASADFRAVIAGFLKNAGIEAESRRAFAIRTTASTAKLDWKDVDACLEASGTPPG